MTKRDHRSRLDHYAVMLTEHGGEEVLNKIEALLENLSAKLQRPKRTRPQPSGRYDEEGATIRRVSPPSAAIRQHRLTDSVEKRNAEGTRRRTKGKRRRTK